MKKLLLPLVLLLVLTVPDMAEAVRRATKVTPLFDLRVRQEIMDGVLYFLPDPDRNQMRFRSRGGLSVAKDDYEFKLLLTNEHRGYIHPDNIPFDWSELILDQLWLQWKSGETSLTIGRQNIIWDDGFLMLEGSPYDGSRSIYQNALRLRKPLGEHTVELGFIYNPKRDPLVLAGDQDLALRDADETALTARLETEPGSFSYIFKRETDPDGFQPDLVTHTLSARLERGDKPGLHWMGDFAGQFQLWADDGAGHEDGFSAALETALDFALAAPTRGKLGFFAYSEDFRTPWGRWPLWSELYIYTLIGESTLHRVHVAAWENIAAPYLRVDHEFSAKVKGKITAYYLLAPATDWDPRGLLVQTRLDFKLDRNLKGHLLWEMLDPGSFHETAPALTETVHFLRWEFIVGI